MDTFPVSYRRIFCNRNLTDEAPLYSKDVEFDSTDHTLVAHFGDPQKFIFKNKLAELVVSVSLPKGMTLKDPKHVESALSKLYQRVKYYQNSSRL